MNRSDYKARRGIWRALDIATSSHATQSSYPEPDNKLVLQFPHFYVLELARVGPEGEWQVQDSVNLRHVGSLSMQAPLSVSRRFTLTGMDEQHSGIRERVFSLQGRTGNLPEQIKNFWRVRDFVEQYATRKQESENAFFFQDPWALILNFSWEGERFFATITDFSYSRDVGDTPHSYRWSLQLKTHGVMSGVWSFDHVLSRDYNPAATARTEATPKAAVDKAVNALQDSPLDVDVDTITGTLSPSELANQHLVGTDGVSLTKGLGADSPTSSGLKMLTSASGTSFSQKYATNLSTVTNAAVRASRQSGGGFLSAAISTVQAAEQSWAGFWSDWVTQPLREASRGRALLSTVASSFRTPAWAFRTAIGQYYYAVPEWRAQVAWFAADVQRSLELYGEGLTELGSMFTAKYWRDVLGISPTRMVATVSSRTRGTVVTVPVPSGARSAYDVAAVVLGSRERWAEVVDANGMRDAYTLGSGIPLESGDVVFVPAPPGTPEVPMNEPFGSDIKLVDGDIALNGTDDFAVVRGVENIQQSMRHRLVTPRGANKAFPGFGLVSRLNERKTSTIYGLLWSDIRDQVSSDPRIQRILRLMMDELPYGYVVQLEYQLIGHARNVVSFQYSLPG